MANPQLLAKQVSDLHQTIPVSPYLLLSSALFIAFIIGSAAIVFLALLIRILKGVYAIRTSLVTAMLTTFLKIIAKQTPLTTTPLHSAYKRRTNADNADRAWRRLAAKLLLDRYGIQPRHLKADWAFYMVALSNPTQEEVAGSMMMHLFHATGWCGLVATLLAPALRTSYYLALCLMLIAGGLVVGYTAAANLEDPLNIALLNMRAVVREYEKGAPHPNPKCDPSPIRTSRYFSCFSQGLGRFICGWAVRDRRAGVASAFFIPQTRHFSAHLDMGTKA